MKKQKGIFFPLFFVVIILLFSCADKKEYEMELTFQREIIAQFMHENDRILQRIKKEIADNGNKAKDVAVRDHAEFIINRRNKYIDSMKRIDVFMENIKPIVTLAAHEDQDKHALLVFYQKKLKEERDSLIFQKFINLYLTFEKKILDEDLSNVSGSCNWGAGPTPHVLKTIDTISLGLNYELEVVPEIFNYKTTYISDTCNITIYRNNVPVEMKCSVMRKGFVYLIALTPSQSGNYKIRGTFTQHSLNHAYVVENLFTDTFVVE